MEIITGIVSRARLDDLYDFNFEAESPAPEAAVLQLGYSSRAPTGKIFKDTFEFKTEWTSNPCPGS